MIGVYLLMNKNFILLNKNKNTARKKKKKKNNIKKNGFIKYVYITSYYFPLF